MKLLAKWLLSAAALLAVAYLYSGVQIQSYSSALIAALVIGLLNSVLRPILVDKDTRMPDWVVMITTLGGMAVFGINGFVIGPVIGAMFLAVWHIHGTLVDEARPD